MKDTVAIIDIGSNTVRLVIYEKLKGGNHYREIENIKKASRLRTFLDDRHSLNEEGIRLLIDTLKSFHTIIELYKVSEVHCVATATIRQAANKENIRQLVKDITGFEMNILSEYEEAYYGFSAVVNTIDIPEGITIDMGGGSTEISYFRERKLIHSISLPFGSLSLKLEFVSGEVPTDGERSQIHQYIGSQLERLPWIQDKYVPIIAMGGSARNIAQVHQSLIDYPLEGTQQYEMSISDIRRVKDRMESLSFSELQNLEGLSKERADTILPAVIVFDMLCRVSKASQFILSRKGLRDGLLYKNQPAGFPSLVDTNIHELMLEYSIDPENGKQLEKIAAMFFEQIKEVKETAAHLTEMDFELLKRGSRLYHLGKFKNGESGPLAFSLLANRTISGLSHRERVKLALVASYSGKDNFRKFIEPFKNWYTKEERRKISLLGVILKLSQSLNTSERNIVQDVNILPKGDCWVITIQCVKAFAPEQYQFEKQKKQIEKLLKIKVVPHFQLLKS